MPELHSTLGWVALGLALVTLVVSLAAAAGLVSRRAVDATVIGVVGATLVAAGVGIVLPVIGSGPSDPLHFVYALVAVVAVPVARVLGATTDARRLGRYVALGAVVVLGAIVRLFMTGR